MDKGREPENTKWKMNKQAPIGLKVTQCQRQEEAVPRQRENRDREKEGESVYSERLEGFK